MEVNHYIQLFIFRCLISSALYSLPVLYGYEMTPSRVFILLTCFALSAILLTFSMNTLCASLLNLRWDFNIIFYSPGSLCNLGILFPVWSHTSLCSLPSHQHSISMRQLYVLGLRATIYLIIFSPNASCNSSISFLFLPWVEISRLHSLRCQFFFQHFQQGLHRHVPVLHGL